MSAELDFTDPLLSFKLIDGELIVRPQKAPKRIAPKPLPVIPPPIPAEPPKDLIDCRAKQRYDKRGAISAMKCAAKAGRVGLRAYACPHCHHWHLSKVERVYAH